MKYTWQDAKKVVENYFSDQCSVATFQPIETEWGEMRFLPKEEKNMICRLVEEPMGIQERGLLSVSKGTAVLLYPVKENLEPGSSVIVKKQGGQTEYFFTVGESISYQTHKEAVLTKISKI